MLSPLMLLMLVSLPIQDLSQSAKIASYSITMVGDICPLENRNGYRTDSFEGGGKGCPAIRAEIEFHFRPTSNVAVLVQLPNEDRPRVAILMRVSLVDVERDQVTSSVLVELSHISPESRSIYFPIGDRASKYQLWFQDSWEENVNGMRRVIRGTFVNLSGTTVNVYPSASNPDDVIPRKLTRRGFKVD